MAIEYLYNAIKAQAGQTITITAEIKDEAGEAVTENCGLMIHNDEAMLYHAHGAFDNENAVWNFIIPAEITAGLKGRFWYCLCEGENPLCFKEPLYLF